MGMKSFGYRKIHCSHRKKIIFTRFIILVGKGKSWECIIHHLTWFNLWVWTRCVHGSLTWIKDTNNGRSKHDNVDNANDIATKPNCRKVVIWRLITPPLHGSDRCSTLGHPIELESKQYHLAATCVWFARNKKKSKQNKIIIIRASWLHWQGLTSRKFDLFNKSINQGCWTILPQLFNLHGHTQENVLIKHSLKLWAGSSMSHKAWCCQAL